MLYGKAYLMQNLSSVKESLDEKWKYYQQTNSDIFKSIAIPRNVLKQYHVRLGWCTKSVDLLANRLKIKRFHNDEYDMTELFANNNSDIFFKCNRYH